MFLGGTRFLKSTVTQPPLYPGVYYHIYNRGNNNENIFIEERNYHYFLQLYGKYIVPIAETYAYCLLRNHFHFLVWIKEHGSSEEPCSYPNPSKQFATFFGTYTKAINKAYNRTGTLFEGRFKRKPIEHNRYFTHLITYIHQNPQKHGFVDDYRDWPYSSYQALSSQKTTSLERDTVIHWFGDLKNFQQFHHDGYDLDHIAALVEDDFY